MTPRAHLGQGLSVPIFRNGAAPSICDHDILILGPGLGALTIFRPLVT